MGKVETANQNEIDKILDQIDNLLASIEYWLDDLDDYIHREPPGYYSATFINQIIERRRKPTLEQAESILETIEDAVEQYRDESYGPERDYDDEPGDRPSIHSD